MIKRIKNKITALKNEKGFTLVELLAVIVILGIILAIAVPAIGNIIDNANTDANQAEEDIIIEAARLADANGDFTDDMTVDELIESGYLEGTDDDLIDGSISFSTESNTYEFTPE